MGGVDAYTKFPIEKLPDREIEVFQLIGEGNWSYEQVKKDRE